MTSKMSSSFTTALLAAPERPFHQCLLELLGDDDSLITDESFVDDMSLDYEDVDNLLCCIIASGCSIPQRKKSKIVAALINLLLTSKGTLLCPVIVALVRLNGVDQLKKAVATWQWREEGDVEDSSEVLNDLYFLCRDNLDFITALPKECQKILLEINKEYDEWSWEDALKEEANGGDKTNPREVQEWERVLEALST